YNFALGGGHGMTHNKPETYPRLATPIAFIPADQLLRGAKAVIELQRDHGDRSNRKHARLKYVVEEKGIAWTRATLEKYYGKKLEGAGPKEKNRERGPRGRARKGRRKVVLGAADRRGAHKGQR